MDMQGIKALAVTQQQAWDALNNPDILKACIAGCDKLEATGEGQYSVGMAVKIGPVAARFNGKIVLTEVNPPDSYTLNFEGQGGAAGFGKGKAAVRLEPVGAQTKLHYSVDASVGGKLAQVGSRLIESAARKLSEEFFAKFNTVVAAGEPAVAEAAAVEAAPELAAAPAGGSPAPAPAESGRGGIPWPWIAGAALVAAAVLTAIGMR